MPKNLRKSQHCLNCGVEIAASNYCPHCGQINTTKRVPFKIFIHDFLGDYFTFDSRFFRSFVPLLKHPGHLTNEYNAGRRSLYILPLRLYVFTTVFFFFVISLNNKIGKNAADIDAPVGNRDTLAQVVDRYGATIPADIRVLIVDEIDGRYRLLPKSKTEERVYRDSLAYLIGQQVHRLSQLERNLLAENILRHFHVGPAKRRSNEPADLDSLRHFLSNRSGLGTNTAQLMSEFDSRFRIDMRKEPLTEWEPGLSFSLQFSEDDTTDTGWQRFLDKKVEHLANQGEAGNRILLREMLNQVPKVMFLVLPLFALILKLLYIRKKIFYISHLIFALHAHTVLFLYLLIAILIPPKAVTITVLFFIWLHLFIALKNVYRQSFIMTFLKLQSLLALYLVPLIFGIVTLTILAVANV